MKEPKTETEIKVNALAGRIHTQRWRYEKHTGRKPTLLFISGPDRDILADALTSGTIMHDASLGKERFMGMEIVIIYGRHAPVVGEEYNA